MTDVSIVIVSYNTSELLRKCLVSVAEGTGRLTVETVVVDNGSQDGSAAMVRRQFPDVRIIPLDRNTGFSKANNIGMKHATGRYVLLLNSDCELDKNTLPEMAAFLDQKPVAGAATCRLNLSDGSIDPACHRGFPTPWASLAYLSGLERLFPTTRLFGGYHMGYQKSGSQHEVDCISGAFFMVRKELIRPVGNLDEDYFMYAEDIDWCYRIKKAGWQIWYNPDVSTVHRKKQSGRRHPERRVRIAAELEFHRNNLKFYRKHYRHFYNPLVSALVEAAYAVRLTLLVILGV
ncbi:hypothetical protein A2Z33_04940 [Candidatus Gottesmanbacteria bacterium RBG_16_52_11]|uniref:Glycosyltransferase 2-like domain-containing protein n=1 Tax=Candidatus Gottesmanbacteria bacterium RBG_16_52_11 TaxID=1798374 RepID=A0A1F5YUP5_9BACT|nr:MAG: hypothetical protein A2Z33_04940 [Candidatus Gottesmanbacteria bacterium RBG_16_52_11]